LLVGGCEQICIIFELAASLYKIKHISKHILALLSQQLSLFSDLSLCDVVVIYPLPVKSIRRSILGPLLDGLLIILCQNAFPFFLAIDKLALINVVLSFVNGSCCLGIILSVLKVTLINGVSILKFYGTLSFCDTVNKGTFELKMIVGDRA